MSLPFRLCRAAVARPVRVLQPVAGPSRIVRRLLHDTPKRMGAAAQLAETEEEPSYYHNPPASLSQQDPSYRRIDSEYPVREQSLVNMPSPLPPDVLNSTDSLGASLYPSTGVLDSISMIAICLRRPEHIPRAYQIFNHILIESRANTSKRTPEADIWGKVIEGVASLGKDKLKAKTWLSRAEVLVARWETMSDVPRGTPALANGGIKIYQGYLSGLLK